VFENWGPLSCENSFRKGAGEKPRTKTMPWKKSPTVRKKKNLVDAVGRVSAPGRGRGESKNTPKKSSRWVQIKKNIQVSPWLKWGWGVPGLLGNLATNQCFQITKNKKKKKRGTVGNIGHLILKSDTPLGLLP